MKLGIALMVFVLTSECWGQRSNNKGWQGRGQNAGQGPPSGQFQQQGQGPPSGQFQQQGHGQPPGQGPPPGKFQQQGQGQPPSHGSPPGQFQGQGQGDRNRGQSPGQGDRNRGQSPGQGPPPGYHGPSPPGQGLGQPPPGFEQFGRKGRPPMKPGGGRVQPGDPDYGNYILSLNSNHPDRVQYEKNEMDRIKALERKVEEIPMIVQETMEDVIESEAGEAGDDEYDGYTLPVSAPRKSSSPEFQVRLNYLFVLVLSVVLLL